MKWTEPRALALLRLVVLALFVGCCPLWTAPQAAHAATAESMAKKLAQEQKRAAERRNSLKRLTDEERKVNASLAAAEKKILQLEKSIEDQQKKLTGLVREDSSAKTEYDALLEEVARTEKLQTETLRLLWEISCKQLSVGGREMVDWARTDREYTWSRELYAALEGYRQTLDRQEAELARVAGRREKLSREMQARLRDINREKEQLLKGRVSYSQRLAALRREKEDAEAELAEILALVENLNLEMEKAGQGKIENLKGRLPWPVKGQVRKKYAPTAQPACRGLGIATVEGQAVQAVAAGKVVHNDVLRGFGTVLILQHGSEYYSLYAFLGGSPLKVGQEVAARARIGTAGYYPAIGGPGLYFELRFKQKAINPEQWLARS